MALLSAGQPILGFVHAPVTDTFYEAVAGSGATRNGEAITASAQATIEGARVTGFDMEDGRIRTVQTTLGPIHCEKVVNCAGMWARDVGAMADPAGFSSR